MVPSYFRTFLNLIALSHGVDVLAVFETTMATTTLLAVEYSGWRVW